MTYELIYASWITTRLDPAFVLDMIKQARVRNRAMGVTSLLLFDGERFCQQLEGEMEAVGVISAAIEHDRRHHDFTTLHAGPLPEGRRFPGWDMAFAMHETGTLSSAISRCSGVRIAEYLQATPRVRIDAE
jgi:hypothetical protein